MYPNKPLFVTEFGYMLNNVADGVENQKIQAQAIRYEYTSIKPHVCGALIWCFADHAWPQRWDLDGVCLFTTYDSPYGLVSRDRKKRQVFDELADMFSL